MTPTTKALPCPCCGSTNITSNEWTVDEDHAKQFDADEHSEIWAFECNNCLAAAPVQSWQNRPDPWRYPPEMPEEGQRVIVMRKGRTGQLVGPCSHRFRADIEHLYVPLLCWMPIPEVWV